MQAGQLRPSGIGDALSAASGCRRARPDASEARGPAGRAWGSGLGMGNGRTACTGVGARGAAHGTGHLAACKVTAVRQRGDQPQCSVGCQGVTRN